MAIDLKKLAVHVQHMWDGAAEGDMARVGYHGGNIKYMIQEEAKASIPIVKPNALEIARERGMDLDPAGNPKLPLTALESLAVDACNRVKAWAESDRKAPFPEDAHMLADGVLMMAAQRRKGVQ